MQAAKLAAYFIEIAGEDLNRLASDSDVGMTTLYKIRGGKRAKPEIYERIALARGTNRVQQRQIYKQLMALSGYLDLLDDEDDSAIDKRFDDLLLAELRRRFPDVVRAAESIIEAQQRGDLEAPKPDSLPAKSS